MTTWRAYAAVGVGSGLGSLLRYLASAHGWGLAQVPLPWATFMVNGLGSWLIAAIAGYAAQRSGAWLSRWQPFLMAGVCGGFTTFSLFGAQTWQLVSLGRADLAAVYALLNPAVWLAAAWLGYRTGQWAAARSDALL